MTDTPPHPLRVLVLDDDEKIRRLLKIFLQQQGYGVATAGDGREGLRKLVRDAFDLVIVDVQMPLLNGVDFARETRKLQPWVELIFCTGYYSDELQRKADRLGIGQILKKPISFNTLESGIESLMTGEPDKRPVAARVRRPLPVLRGWFQDVLADPHLDAIVERASETAMRLLPARAAAVLLRDEDYTSCTLRSAGPLARGEADRIREEIDRHLYQMGEEPACVQAARHEEVENHGGEERTLRETPHLLAPVTGNAGLDGFVCAVLDVPEATADHHLALMQFAHHLELAMQAMRSRRDTPGRDALTGVMNRKWIEERVDDLWRHRRLSHISPGAVILDLDDLGAVNRAHGNPAGNQLLRETVRQLRDLLKPGMHLGRVGGDQFMVLLDQTDSGGLERFTRTLRERMRDVMLDLPGDPVRITTTLATVMLGEEREIHSGAEWIECAEHTLQTAKREGGGQALSWSELCDSDDMTYDRHSVLVVDDDPQVFHLIRRMLNKNLYGVTGAATVAEAVKLLEEGKKFHVLLTDLALPHQDGTDMMRLAQQFDPDMVLVVISGNISNDSDENLRAKGAFDIIRKPFDIQRVRTVVSKAVETRTRTLRREKKIRTSSPAHS